MPGHLERISVNAKFGVKFLGITGITILLSRYLLASIEMRIFMMHVGACRT